MDSKPALASLVPKYFLNAKSSLTNEAYFALGAYHAAFQVLFIPHLIPCGCTF